MRLEKAQSFVLATINYGESDRIVSLFTLEHGRIRVFARKSRNSRKRFGAALEMFARIEAHVGLKQGLSVLRQAEVLTLFPGIRAALTKIAHALYACELVNVMTPEGHPLPRLFRLLSAYLNRLEVCEASEAERRFFEINLLNILGYRPSLEACCRCGGLFGERDAKGQDNGEFTCADCSAHGKRLSPLTLKRMLACLGTGTFGLVDFPEETLRQAGSALDDAIYVHAGRRLKSLDFIRETSL